MRITPKKIIIPVLAGFIIWIIAFFVIGWTVISEDPNIQALYFPMVGIFTLGTLMFLFVFLSWYFPYLNIDISQNWFSESLLLGIIIMITQVLLDIFSFTFLFPTDLFAYFFGLFTGDPNGSTVLVVYPLIVLWSIVAGYIVQRKEI